MSKSYGTFTITNIKTTSIYSLVSTDPTIVKFADGTFSTKNVTVKSYIDIQNQAKAFSGYIVVKKSSDGETWTDISAYTSSQVDFTPPSDATMVRIELYDHNMGTLLTSLIIPIVGNGVGISTIIEHYIASEKGSEITIESQGWTEDVQATTNQKQCLWNYTTIVYTDGSTSNTDPCIIGYYGDKGVGVKSITEQYYLSTSNTTQAGGSWLLTCPQWAEGYYIWTRSHIVWTDDSETNTDAVLAGAINSANEIANGAKATADGKNTIYYNTTAPSGDTYKVNDIWFDTDDGNKIYHWDGSAWAQGTFGDSAVSNLNAAKITAGYLDVARLKAESIQADKIAYNTITADKLAVGSGNNIYMTGYDTFESITNDTISNAQTNGGFDSIGIDTSTAYMGTQCLKLVSSSTAKDQRAYLGVSSNKWGSIALNAGKTYIISAYVKGTAGATAKLWVYGRAAADNGTSSARKAFTTTLTADWTRLWGYYTAESDYPYIRLAVGVITASSTMYVDAIMVESGTNKQSPSEFTPAGNTLINGANIITGTITASAIHSGSITTDQIAAGTITTNNLALKCITADKIDSGAVTSDKIAVGVITADSGIIADAAITNAKIQSIDASKITTGILSADRIESGAITSEKLSANAITGKTITGGSIVGAEFHGTHNDTEYLTVNNEGIYLHAENGLFKNEEYISIRPDLFDGGYITNGTSGFAWSGAKITLVKQTTTPSTLLSTFKNEQITLNAPEVNITGSEVYSDDDKGAWVFTKDSFSITENGDSGNKHLDMNVGGDVLILGDLTVSGTILGKYVTTSSIPGLELFGVGAVHAIGKLKDVSLVYQKGIIAQITLTVYNSSSVSAGGDLFKSKLVDHLPRMISRGVGYYGSCACLGLIETDGTITVRVIGGTMAANAAVDVSFVYFEVEEDSSSSS